VFLKVKVIMPQINSQRLSQIYRKIFEILWFEPEGFPAREIIGHLSKSMMLSDQEKHTYNTDSRYTSEEIMIRMATIPLEKVGFLVKTGKGKWYITEKGRDISKKFNNAQDFFDETMRQYEEQKDKEMERMEQIYSIVANDSEEKSWEQIQKFLLTKESSEFKYLVSELLKSIGLHLTENLNQEKSSSYFDFIAHDDPFGFKGSRTIIKINQQLKVFTMDEFTQFRSTMIGEDHGMIFSFNGFTNEVITKVLSSTTCRNIRLFDLDKFVELWIENYDKLRSEAKMRFPLKTVYFLSFQQ
jgi:hypothetical protein